MTFNVLNRQVHYWTSIIVALPLGVMISTGLLLQMKKQWDWVQPPEQRGTGTAPQIDLEDVLPPFRSKVGTTSIVWTSGSGAAWSRSG